jgi:chloramphenicol O-acetyltransferase type A
MKDKLDLQNWTRKPHFDFFSKFQDPFYGVCVNIQCGAAYRFAKANGVSFFLYSIYQSLRATLKIEPFRQRIENGEVFIYDRIHAASTIARPNGTFGYGYFSYRESLDEFVEAANIEAERVQNGNNLEPGTTNDVIRYSSLPWVNFTSLSHAWRSSAPDSCPRISFGKMTDQGPDKSMPASIHVNHALVDGLHVGAYIDVFQELMNPG